MTRSRAAGAALAIVVLAALITPFGRELFCGDETKYSEVVREMRASGQWFLPPLEGVPFTHKPPLHFWEIGALTYVFGTYSMWSYVLPSLIALAFLTWLMWRMGGVVAAFVCATSILVWGSAQTARMDVSFTALITFAVWMLQRKRLGAAGVALAIATLIKGPMAPIIVIVLFALEWWRTRDVPRGNYAAALAAMVVIPLLWFIPAMKLGGGAYTHEVLQKQLAGRAIASWVHQSPPWYYVLHSPGFLFPWFGALVAALVARWREERFNINWILAVLLPYSLMSSKLDVYMMAMIPPVALIIANAVDRVRIGNVITLAILLLAAIAGPFINIKGAPPLTSVFIVLGIASAAALVACLRCSFVSTIATGLVPIIVLAFVALTMMPTVNALASGKPLVDTLASMHVSADQIALYYSPHLWAHDMPRDLEHVHYVSPEGLKRLAPTLIVTPRKRAADIASSLAGYHVIRTVQLIGKPFDVFAK